MGKKGPSQLALDVAARYKKTLQEIEEQELKVNQWDDVLPKDEETKHVVKSWTKKIQGQIDAESIQIVRFKPLGKELQEAVVYVRAKIDVLADLESQPGNAADELLTLKRRRNEIALNESVFLAEAGIEVEQFEPIPEDGAEVEAETPSNVWPESGSVHITFKPEMQPTDDELKEIGMKRKKNGAWEGPINEQVKTFLQDEEESETIETLEFLAL